ncbi:hypothetical protein SAMN05421505_111206 [Sinosporangium album]|uniref:Uncharacterized protein n=1 Tax=Sinosporangium album TaxID=504805 RepID=A0A1G7ZU65_9ACTN|nr:hypothetical protein [Sinosporangium album]SDH12255.1 hypothetical protein SAMN05421505_111206 [Sinosporangium album]
MADMAPDDPVPLGYNVVKPIFEGSTGRVFAMDSLLYVATPEIGEFDVVIASSFCGVGTVDRAFRHGVRAVIAHDAGVGKDQAGISALPYGDRFGMPVAAVDGRTGEVSNGLSLAAGLISHANELAQSLGVRPGQRAVDAATLMLKAPRGRPQDTEVEIDDTLYEMGTTETGRILAIRALTSLPEDQDYSSDIVAVGVHAGQVWGDLVKRWRVKGWLANDAGIGKNRGGIGGLFRCEELGMPAASISADSARIDDGLSSYHEGIVSAVNSVAAEAGVTVGMRVPAAMLLMSAARPAVKST